MRFLFLILSCAVSALGEVDTQGIKAANLVGAKVDLMHDHDPASELKHFTLLDGFQANLFAREPMLANPIHLGWDAKGRLYVACSWSYPQVKPGQPPNDKIIVLEDRDGDGRADTSTVFADGLYIPTGIEIANGGVYVAQTPDLLFFKDTDGDGKADLREVALTGFGIEDSHHSISAVRRGPGGYIYMQEGIFLHTAVETQHGLVRNFNGGVYQYHPKSQRLRVFANVGVGNPWGHVIDRWGQSFIVDNPRVIYLTPGTGNGNRKLRLPNLASTEKQCGGDLVSGTHFPESMRGEMLTCRFKSRRIVRYAFSENGSGYGASVLAPLISSAHPNFRPVDCKIGPDGALYVADWYNSIINHAQHDFRDPRRDHEHGRIWRITAKDRPLVERPDLTGNPGELVDHLKSPNTWTRHYARLALSEKDPTEVAGVVKKWAVTMDPKDPDHAHHLVEAVWTLQNIQQVDEKLLLNVLSCEDGRARAAAARMIRYWAPELTDPVGLIARAADDPHPRVRLEALLSAGYLEDARALPAALIAMDHPTDPSIDIALPQTIEGLRPYWEPALAEEKLEFFRAEHRRYLSRQTGPGADDRLKEMLSKNRGSAEELSRMRRQLIEQPNQKQMRTVVDALAKRGGAMSPAFFDALADALAETGRRRPFGLGRKLNPLVKQFGTFARTGKVDRARGLAEVLGVWQHRESGRDLAEVAGDSKQPFALRRTCAVSLGRIAKPENLKVLRGLAQSAAQDDRYLAAHGLSIAAPGEATNLAAALLQEDPGGRDPAALVDAFTGRRSGAEDLAAALEGKQVHAKVIAAVAERVRRTGPLPESLSGAFQPVRPASLSAALLKEDRAKLVAEVNAMGDPERGEWIYRRKTVACMVCHAINGSGPGTGPDLAAVGGAATTEYLVESILEPNKAIAEHYDNVLVVSDDQSVRNGVIRFQSQSEIVLADARLGGREVSIPRKRIKQITPLPSLMPPGLADQLADRQEFLDLAHFVSRLGRPGPYAASDAPVIRTWNVRERGGTWRPAYSLVRGELPARDIGDEAEGVVQVQREGAVRLLLNSTKGLTLKINDRPVSGLDQPLTLQRGTARLTFQVDRKTRGDIGLRVELAAPAGSTVRFQVQAGPGG